MCVCDGGGRVRSGGRKCGAHQIPRKEVPGLVPHNTLPIVGEDLRAREGEGGGTQSLEERAKAGKDPGRVRRGRWPEGRKG